MRVVAVSIDLVFVFPGKCHVSKSATSPGLVNSG